MERKKRIQRAYKNLEELQDKDRIKTVAEKNGNYVQSGSLETGFVETKNTVFPYPLMLPKRNTTLK